MKKLFLLLLVLTSTVLEAQNNYDPANPPDPQMPEKQYNLTCRTMPAGAGSVNVSSGKYAAGKAVSVTTSGYSNYHFVCWLQDNDTISRSAGFTFTMPEKNVVLTAVYTFEPNSPANPDAPESDPGKDDDIDPEPDPKPDYDPAVPGNPGANTFDAQTGIAIIGDFSQGSLRSAISNAISGYSSSDVRQIIVQGNVNNYDISVANDYPNCTMIDFSRCPNLKVVPSGAYYGNGTLEQIILPSSLERIESNAFCNATKLSEITCYASVPPAVGNNAFNAISPSAVAYVPAKSIGSYQAATGWSSLVIKEGKNKYAVDFTVTDITLSTTDLSPKGKVSLTWKVSNEGDSDSNGGWKEYIYLCDDNATSPVLYTLNYNSTLASQASVSRSATFSLPEMPGVHGNVTAKVVIMPTAGAGESVQAQVNNVGFSAGTAVMGKCLYVSSVSKSIKEGTSGIAVTVRRSGNCTAEETLSLTVKPEGLTNMPETVTIKGGDSNARFIVSVPDNSEVNGTDSLYFTASGSGYEAVTLPIAFEDNDTYPLTVTLDKTEYSEGDTIRAIVSVGKASETILPVTLNIEHTKRFRLPSSVAIKAGEKQTAVAIPVLNDNIPSNDEGIEIKASAEGYDVATAMFILKDDDVPAIDMTLLPATVTENAGSEALQAVITRRDVTGNKITLRLADDGNDAIFYNNTVVMDEGVTEVIVPIGVKDNVKVDGTREVSLTASIYISTCNCNATGTKQSMVTKTMTILDNDGPALTLTNEKTVIMEGDTEGAVFTLKRNDSTVEALPVKLTADAADIVLPAQVTIPPGNESTSFTLYAKKNGTQEGNRIVNVKAECEGYTMGAAYILVTDRTLPDMTVESITVNPVVVETNQKYKVTVKVRNIGAAETPERSTVTLKAGEETLTLTIPEAIAIDGEKTLTAEFKAPAMAKVCEITAIGNANRAFQELQTVNNTASVSVEVLSPYTMTVTADRKAYNIGETIRLTGSISSKTQGISGIRIEPYVICHGERTALEAITGADGSFALDYTLPQGVGGDYALGVCLPDEGSTTSVSHFGVYGMTRANSSYYKLRMYKNEPYTLSVPIRNISSLEITNITATAQDASGHYKVKTKAIKSIPGNEQGELQLEITSSAVSSSTSWERVMVSLESTEGARTSFPIYCYCASHEAVVEASTREITTTVSKSASRLYPVIITNRGLGETGKMTVDIPAGQAFLSLASSSAIPSLAAGDSTTVMLRFNPTGLDVNVTQRGTIGINCEKADGIAISYNVKVVSEEKGSLCVRVMDENTEYGNAKGEHPYVSGAKVTVKDYNNGIDLFSATTDEDGYARFEGINEGAYRLYVTASRHDSYTQNVMVSPGEETEHVAYVSYQAISVSFTVEETTIEDKYDITSEFVYETQVPVPVVVMECPDELDMQKVVEGGTLLYNIVLTNKGLINADNVCVTLPEEEGVDFIALTEYSGLTLSPGQSWTIPVQVTLAKGSTAGAKGSSSYYHTDGLAGDAVDAGIEGAQKLMHCDGETYLGWEYPCSGNEKAEEIAKYVKYLLATCEARPSDPENKPQKTVKQVEPEDPVVYPERELEVRRWTVKSQVDLYSMYQYACKISCSLQCFPISKSQLKDAKAKDIIKCIWTNASRTYNAKSTDNTNSTQENALKSLYDNYKVKYDLMMAIDSLQYALNDEVINAPLLSEDAETYLKVRESISAVDENIIARHKSGTLYDATASQLYDENIVCMPQQMADWYDFSLGTYIERQTNYFRQMDGMSATNDNVIDISLVSRLKTQLDSCDNVMKDMGYVEYEELFMAVEEDAKVLSEASANTCASVKFQINQEMVLTRQAFRGTMTIENSTNERLTDISTAITATDEAGVQATAREMQISLESIQGFADSSDGTWTLEPGAVGIATYLFIPTKYAAPEKAEVYSFGGSLYFNDGENEQARSLYPCSLTVKPSPELDLIYFMQRDLYGDNPLTEDVSEPVIPAEFTLLIHNKGAGEAQSVKVITHQPEIVDNEKGLAVDFAIVSSSLNGKDKAMTLANDIATDFGAIPAGGTSYATWDITSSLLGHLREYNVSYTHVTSFNNPDLSLLDKVTIHELIHSINARRAGKVYRAWVVNDEADTYDLPDRIYFSDGTDNYLHALPDAAEVEVISDTQCRITVNAVTKEWIYSKVDNPMDADYAISRITNVRTGEELDPENFWTSRYVMLDGKDPEERPLLHIVDFATSAGDMVYVIDFDTTKVTTGMKPLRLTATETPQGIYTITGIKVAANADRETISRLPRGIYIINRRKVYIP